VSGAWILSVAATAAVSVAVAGGLTLAAPGLPPADPARTADGAVVAFAAATALALGALPAGGLVAPPVVPVPAACLAFAFGVRVRGPPSARRSLAWIPPAVGAGLLVLFGRGIAAGGPEFVGAALRPPSLPGSAALLAAGALASYPLGRVARSGSAAGWPLAAAAAAAPPATVALAALRPFHLAGPLLPVVVALVATLLGAASFRLGHAGAHADGRPTR
jgi:hypothetical protein